MSDIFSRLMFHELNITCRNILLQKNKIESYLYIYTFMLFGSKFLISVLQIITTSVFKQ